jgi:hypothetical protein
VSNDPFITRLRSTVIGEGMLLEGNIYLIDYAIKNMPKGGNVLEIGSYGGLSANLTLFLIKKYNRNVKFLNCDPWIYEGYRDYTGEIDHFMDGNKDVSRADFMEYIKRSFMASVRLLSASNLPHTFEMKSNDFFEMYRTKNVSTDLFGNEVSLGGKFSFVYIDGEHSYESVKSDFNNVNQFLMSGGFVLFDDSADGVNMGSAKFMTEMKNNKEYALVEKNPNYLFKKH